MADWETFKFNNPQYDEDLQWKWFKEVRRRYDVPITDSDWPYWNAGSQPDRPKPERQRDNARKADAGQWNAWKPRNNYDNKTWNKAQDTYGNADGSRGRRSDRGTSRGRASNDQNTWQGGETGNNDDPWKQQDPWAHGTDPHDAAKKQDNGDPDNARLEKAEAEGRAETAMLAEAQGGVSQGQLFPDKTNIHENGDQGQGQQPATGGGDGGGHDGDQAGGKEGGAAGGGKGGGKGGGQGGGKGRGRGGGGGKGGGKGGWTGGGKGGGKPDTPGADDENGGKGGGGGGGQAGNEARSQDLNGRRSPEEQAWPIDIFKWAAASKPMAIEWQFLEYDCNGDIALCRRYYWQQYDERDHAPLTAAYQSYLDDVDDSGGNQTHMTGRRNPGRSPNTFDQHETDFVTLRTVNTDPKHHSPKRAVRVVVITECEKEDVLGSLPIADNNQEVMWQYEDYKGWKNYCTHHIGEINQAVLADKKEVTLKAWYPDAWLQMPRHTKITVDLENMKQIGRRSERKVRVVHVTPILQKGDDGVEAPSQHTNQPVWSAQGPRIENPDPDQ